MRRHAAILLVVLLLVLAGLGAYAAWAIHAGSKIGAGWAGLSTAWPFLLAGVLTVDAVIAAFVWLAFFSERRGFDDHAGIRKR